MAFVDFTLQATPLPNWANVVKVGKECSTAGHDIVVYFSTSCGHCLAMLKDMQSKPEPTCSSRVDFVDVTRGSVGAKFGVFQYPLVYVNGKQIASYAELYRL